MNLFFGPSLDSHSATASFLQGHGFELTNIPRNELAAGFFVLNPNLNQGLATLREALKQMPSVPFLAIVSQNAEPTAEGKAILSGCRVALREPFQWEQLHQWVQDIRRPQKLNSLIAFHRENVSETLSFYTSQFLSQFHQKLPFDCSIRAPITGNVVLLKRKGETMSELECQNLLKAGVDKILVSIEDYDAQVTYQRKVA